MASKKSLPKYEAPRIRDLSEFGANGQTQPEGICMGGGQLTYQYCTSGDTPTGGTCSPTGLLPNMGYCRTGNNAVEGCTSGSIHN